MVNEHLKRCRILLFVREIVIKNHNEIPLCIHCNDYNLSD